MIKRFLDYNNIKISNIANAISKLNKSFYEVSKYAKNLYPNSNYNEIL